MVEPLRTRVAPILGQQMSELEQNRKLADKARSDAAAASLPNVREVHLRSAERLEEIIARINSISGAKSRNEQAKRDLEG